MINDPIQLPRISIEAFEKKVTESNLPVVVLFSTGWSGYGFFLQASLGNIAGKFEEEVAFFILDTDQNPALAKHFGVSSTSALLIFKEGKVADFVTAPLPEQEIEGRIKKLLD